HERKQSDEATGFHTRDCRSTGSYKPLGMLCRGLCHDRYLVDAVAFSVLPEPLLRSVDTEFLSISCCLSRHCAAADLPEPTQCPVAQLARGDDMFRSLSSLRRPRNHPGNRPFLHGPGRVRHLYAALRDLHLAARARLSSRSGPRYSSMPVSCRQGSWPT